MKFYKIWNPATGEWSNGGYYYTQWSTKPDGGERWTIGALLSFLDQFIKYSPKARRYRIPDWEVVEFEVNETDRVPLKTFMEMRDIV
jgi:hypothetical protein